MLWRVPSPCKYNFLSRVKQFTITTSNHPSASTARVNKDRLWADIHYTSQFGQGERWGKGETETGMPRLALSDADREARNWFVATTESLGCSTTVDRMGNIFAIRKGRSKGSQQL